jgi:hypothetical protein
MKIEINIFTVLGKGFEELYVREETAHLATLKSKKIISRHCRD